MLSINRGLCYISSHFIVYDWKESTKIMGAQLQALYVITPRITPHSHEHIPPPVSVCKLWNPVFYKLLSCPIQSHSYTFIYKKCFPSQSEFYSNCLASFCSILKRIIRKSSQITEITARGNNYQSWI